MDNNFGTFKAARLPTVTTNKLPGDITSAKINTAILPAQLEAARTAIARCTDLSELLTYRDKAEALAAAVRVMKQVGPEMVRQANEIMADSWRKGGELLLQYSNTALANKGPGTKQSGSQPSPRRAIAEASGISRREMAALVRIASAPKEAIYREVQKTTSFDRVAASAPPTVKNFAATHPYSEAYKILTVGKDSGHSTKGLNSMATIARHMPLDQFKLLTPDERKNIKAKITEIAELLDEMDRLCR